VVTNADDRSILRFFILCGNRRWTEEDDGEEDEESEGQPREEASGVRPRWTRHVGEGKEKKVLRLAGESQKNLYIFILDGHVVCFATSSIKFMSPCDYNNIVHS
jgi:hypothetical protein